MSKIFSCGEFTAQTGDFVLICGWLDQGCPSGLYTVAMRPDASSPSPSPFLGLPKDEWLCANEHGFAIYDRFPVSPGHVLVITHRVVPTFFECTAAEQQALMALVGEVKALLDERLDPKPDGYNVGFNSGAAAGQTVPHVHVHVIPRYAGDTGDPRGGVRHVIPGKGNYLAGPPTCGGGAAALDHDRPGSPALAPTRRSAAGRDRDRPARVVRAALGARRHPPGGSRIRRAGSLSVLRTCALQF